MVAAFGGERRASFAASDAMLCLVSSHIAAFRHAAGELNRLPCIFQ